MDYPGEKLVIRLWETVAEKGIGGLLRPWQMKRESRALLESRQQELLVLAQAERDADEIRTGRKRLGNDGRLLSVESAHGDFDQFLGGEHTGDSETLARVLLHVSTERMIADSIRSEVNVAKALLQAEVALENDSEEPPRGTVDEDWLYRWRDCTASVSTEKLQSMWGSLLAGEVKSPGTFSLRTLDFLRNLSCEEATNIERLFQFALNHWVIRGCSHWDDRFDGILAESGLTYGFLLDMQELGVISGVESGTGFRRTLSAEREDKFISALISHTTMLLITHDDPKRELEINGYTITALGRQLEQLAKAESDKQYVRQLGKAIASRGFDVFLTTPDAFENEKVRAEDGRIMIPGESIEALQRSDGCNAATKRSE
jgi:hypothetical protein